MIGGYSQDQREVGVLEGGAKGREENDPDAFR